MKTIETIDGNFLSPSIFKTLNNINKKLEKNFEKNDLYFVLKGVNQKNRIYFSIISNEKTYSFNVQNNNKEKYIFALNTVRYQLLGFFILDIINIEPTRKFLKKIKINESIKIKINISKNDELFKDVPNEELDSFYISSYIYKQTKVKDSFAYKMLNSIIDEDETKIINLTYNKYFYKNKINDYYFEIKDPRLKKYINTLYDGVSGEYIKNKLFNDYIKDFNYFFDKKNISKNLIEEIEERIIEVLKNCLRYDFRKSVIEDRNKIHKNKTDLIFDLEYLNILNKKGEYVEAAHIMPVSWITKKIINELKTNKKITKEDIYHNEFIKLYRDPKNGIMIPFNYHKLYDDGKFFFDIDGSIKYDKKNKELKNILKVYSIDTNAKISFPIDEKMKKFIIERKNITKNW